MKPKTMPMPALEACDLERQILGGIFADNDRYADVMDSLHPDDFVAPHNRVIYKVMGQLYRDAADRKMDIFSVHEGWRVECGDGGEERMRVLVQIQHAATSGEYVLQHAEWLRDLAIKRRILKTCQETQEALADGEGYGEVHLTEVENKIMGIRNLYVPSDIADVVDEVDEVYQEFKDRCEGKLPPEGLMTGFRKFDRITGGLKPGKVIILAARPGVGKSAFAVNIATNLVLHETNPMSVMFYSLEMVAKEITERVVYSVAKVSMELLKDPSKISVAEKSLVKKAVEQIKTMGKHRFVIDPTPAMEIHELYTRAKRAVVKYGAKLIIVDYIQLMGNKGTSKHGRQQEVQSISNILKIIAKKLKVPVLVLSQLNRDIEKRDADESKPQLSDLRDSGALEQDADIVTFIHRPNAIGTKVAEAQRNSGSGGDIATLIVAKHRSGPVGEVNMRFRNDITRFEEIGEG